MTDETDETNETNETISNDLLMSFLAARHRMPERDPNKKYHYDLVHFDDLQPSRTSLCQVEGILPREGLADVWGPPKSGKSFWTFDLVMHVALGWPYRGRDVEQGPVVYCAFEGGNHFGARVEAFRRTHDMGPRKVSGIEIETRPWFYLLASSAKLVRDHKAMIEAIDGQTKGPPTIVVLDTLNRSIDGSESKDVDMGAYLTAGEAIYEEFACLVIIIHHCGVNEDRPRGHTSLTGAVVVEISIKRDAADNVVAKIEAMRDGPEGDTFVSKLQPIEVGTDAKGKPITSCAIVKTDAVVPGPKLTKTQKLAYDALKRTIKDDGVEAKAGSEMAKRGVPIGARACMAESWRQQFYNLHDAKKPAAKRQALFRATLDLEEAGLLRLAGEYVYLPGS
jgi:AAA domain